MGLAILVHSLLLAALTWGVHWKREVASLEVEAELWSTLAQQAAPQLAEVLPEAPALAETVPAKLTPSNVDIALAQEELEKKEQEFRRLAAIENQRIKQQEEKKLIEKKRVQDKLAQDKRLAENQKNLEQELQRKEAAKQIEILRQANLKRIAGLAGATGSATGDGAALHTSGPSDSYAGRIRARIRPNIVFSDEVTGNPRAEVEVRTSPDGTIISRRLMHASGVKSWDDAVLRAIDKTETLPRDIDGRVISPLVIGFTPKD
jgi:colicin import membrane protein